MSSKATMNSKVEDYTCLVCEKQGANNHAFKQEDAYNELNAWYTGVSWHTECIDIHKVISEAKVIRANPSYASRILAEEDDSGH